jgi:PAS domain S-box-containing protein
MAGTLLMISLGLSLACIVALVFSHRRKAEAVAQATSLRKLNQDLSLELSDKIKIEQNLPDSEDRFRGGIDDVGAALWEWNLVDNLFFASDLVLKATGYHKEEMNEDPQFMLDLVHSDHKKLITSSLAQLRSGQTDEVTLEIRILFADQQYHWINTRVVAARGDDGQVLRLVGSFSDITARISAEEERDRLFNLSIDMLAVWGFDGILQQVNPAWVRVLGWSRDDLMGRPLLFFVHPEDQDITSEAFDSIFHGQPIEELDMRFRCRNGSYLWLSWSSFPYPDREVVFSVVKDITHNKMAERKLLDYQDRLRSLSTQLSLVEDRQRKELASAIHDGLAQQLFGIRAKVTLFKFPQNSDKLTELVAETLSIIDETMGQARSLSFELFPPVLHEVGLEAALSWLGHQFSERTGIACTVSVEGKGPELNEDLRTMAFQSVRELLANIRKHSEADSCTVTVNHVDGFLTIVVEDPGKGFNVLDSREQSGQNDPSGGFGLFSIRERTRSVHGRMLVDYQPGKGCRVFLTFPNDRPSTALTDFENPET